MLEQTEALTPLTPMLRNGTGCFSLQFSVVGHWFGNKNHELSVFVSCIGLGSTENPGAWVGSRLYQLKQSQDLDWRQREKKVREKNPFCTIQLPPHSAYSGGSWLSLWIQLAAAFLEKWPIAVLSRELHPPVMLSLGGEPGQAGNNRLQDTGVCQWPRPSHSWTQMSWKPARRCHCMDGLGRPQKDWLREGETQKGWRRFNSQWAPFWDCGTISTGKWPWLLLRHIPLFSLT